MTHLPRFLALFLVVGLATTPSLAQIDRSNHATEQGERALPGEWVPGYGFPGVSGQVFAIAPTSDRLFLGGSFSSAGNESVSGLGQFSTTDLAWSGVGEGVNGAVHALAVGPEGILYIGGNFTVADGLEANRIAQYDPDTDTWTALDDGVDGVVVAIAVADDGTVYAAGDFSTAGIVPAVGIAAWDGESWAALGDVEGDINQLLILGGKLYAGGNFSAIGDLQVSNVAAYDPASQSWSALSQGVDGLVTAMTAWGSWLYVGGNFDNAFQSDGTAVPSKRVARWDPLLQAWTSAALDVHGVTALGTDHNGVVYAGTDALGEEWSFARLIGDSWEPIGLDGLPMWGLRWPSQIVSVGDRLAIGLSGIFLPDGNPDPAQFLYSFDPATDEWGVFAEPVGMGIDQTVRVLAGDNAGGLYTGGDFSFAGPVRADGLAYLSPEGIWESLGGGVDGTVQALLAHGEDSAYVGGWFDSAVQPDGQAVSTFGIARWDRTAGEWSPLGGGVQIPSGSHGSVDVMAHGADGSLIVGGAIFQVEQPDGSILPADRLARWLTAEAKWEAFPADHGMHHIQAIATDELGILYVLGEVIPVAGWPYGRLVRLLPDASEWELLREWPSEQALDLALWGDPAGAEGELYVAITDGVWRWSDSSWQSIAGPSVAVSLVLNGVPGANGLLYAGASSSSGQAGPWAWDGTDWTLFEGHVASAGDSPHVFTLDLASRGDGTASLWIGGYFARAGGAPSAGLARWDTQDFTVSAEEPSSVATALELAVFPNPLGGDGTIEFALPSPGEVRVTVYDLLGRRVLTLLEEDRAAGVHRLDLPAESLANGTYVVRLITGAEQRAKLVTRVE